MPICRKGKQRLTEHTVLTGLQPEPFCLFIHTAVCLLKEKGQLSSSPEGKQKASMCRQEQSKVCNKMDALKIEGDKHNVVYISGARLWGKRAPPLPHTRRPTARGSRWGRFCAARISGGVIERCEGGGLCHGSHQCDVTYLSNFLLVYFQTCCTQTRPLNLKIKHYRDDVCLK